MIINLNLGEKSYNIYLGRGEINRAAEHFNLDRKVLIVTDSGVPKSYAETVSKQCREPYICTVPEGEQTKCIEQFTCLLQKLTDYRFTRTDCVVAVGGGVVGDLSGFAAAAYMRGIDFYNIPTTVLSQVDSSIGGKVAIDFGGYKNTVGAFHQPKAVIVDSDLLKTLPQRQISNGLAESVKMALTCDKQLFQLIESGDPMDNIDKIIEGSLLIKKAVVEQDEKETGLRKVLNFGHTLAHAIESEYKMSELYHGECVAIGMLPMCSESVAERLKPILEKLNLPTKVDLNRDTVISAMKHDKKLSGDKLTVINVNEIGSFQMTELTVEQLSDKMKGVYTS